MTYRALNDSLPFVQIVSNRASRRPGKGSLLHLLQFLRQSLRRGSSHCALAAILFTMYGRVRGEWQQMRGCSALKVTMIGATIFFGKPCLFAELFS